jgi:predicted anti-sigma-YlaC factor YlaD
VEFLMDYLEGAMPQAERVAFEEHLKECPDCIAYLDTYRSAIRLGQAVCTEDHDAGPPEVPEALVRAVLAALRRGQP